MAFSLSFQHSSPHLYIGEKNEHIGNLLASYNQKSMLKGNFG